MSAVHYYPATTVNGPAWGQTFPQTSTAPADRQMGRLPDPGAVEHQSGLDRDLRSRLLVTLARKHPAGNDENGKHDVTLVSGVLHWLCPQHQLASCGGWSRWDELVAAVRQADDLDSGRISWREVDEELTGDLEYRQLNAEDICQQRVREALHALLGGEE